MINISEQVDKDLFNRLNVVEEITKRIGVPYLVVGATARDMILHFGYGAKINRATNDVDFGLLVENWAQFNEVRDALLSRGYQQREHNHHQFTDRDGKHIDVVPFGGVELGQNVLEWAPEGEIEMNVMGFSEAHTNAELVRVSADPILDVPVATPPGLALLKSIAWADRDTDIRAKDANDLIYLCQTYEKIPSVLDRIYEELEIEKFDYDPTLAASHLLGIESCTHLESDYDSHEAMFHAFSNGIFGID